MALWPVASLINQHQRVANVVVNLTLVLLSLSPLAGFEMYLWLTDFGHQNRVLIYDADKDAYVMNREIYRKYFPSNVLVKNSKIPEVFKPFRTTLEVKAQKGPNDYRIFCFGGSTTRGDFSKEAFPSILGKIFEESKVARNVEVYNLGITTLNSFQVADFVDEVVTHHKPDLLIIYMGHNEIYGPLGVASTAQIGKSYWLTRTMLALHRLRTFQWMQRKIDGSHPQKDKKKRAQALFQAMAKSPVPYTSPMHDEAEKRFRKNLKRILSNGHTSEVPIVISTVASNFRDFKPFSSDLPKDPEKRFEWQIIMRQARTLGAANRYAEAETHYREAMKLFPDNAQQYYELGHLYRRQGKNEEGWKLFQQAVDHDPIPFRAPSWVNKTIQNTAQEMQVILFDTEQFLREQSEQMMIGKPIMVEHLHPSTYGHYLIAAGLARTIFDEGLLKEKRPLPFNTVETLDDLGIKKNQEKFRGDRYWPFTINNRDYRFP